MTKIFFSLPFLALLLIPTGAVYSQATYDEIQAQIKAPQPRIEIPGVKFTDPKDIQVTEGSDGNQYMYVPYLGEFIAAVYRFGAVAISIMAVITIILAGLQWMLPGNVVTNVLTKAGGDKQEEQINKAKQQIIKSIGALLLVMISYSFLYFINPNLVEFKNLKILLIQGIGLEATIPLGDEVGEGGATGALGQLREASGSNIVYRKSATDKRMRTDLATAFEKAAAAYGAPIYVNFSLRSADVQYNLMQKHCGCPESNTLPPNVAGSEWPQHCSRTSGCKAAWRSVSRVNGTFQGSLISHTGGNALDLMANGGVAIKCSDASDDEVKQSSGVINTDSYVGNDWCIPANQQKLIRVMLQNGFCVGLKGTGLRENWHFELMGNSLRKSSFCTNDFNDPNLKKLYYAQR